MDTETLVDGSNEKPMIYRESAELTIASTKNSSVGEAAAPFIASEKNELGSAYDKSNPETLIGANTTEHMSSIGAIELIVKSDSDTRGKDLILNPTGFYTWAQDDRSGSVIQDMMFQHARLFSYNLTYLGACIRAVSDANLHRSTHEALIRAIGLEDVLKFSCPDDLAEMERQPPGAQMNMYDAWTPEWIDYIRSKTKYPKTTTAENQTVVHIRRGDVDPCLKIQGTLGNRYLPNSYFKAVIEKYIPKDSSITVYSEKQSFEPWKDWSDFSRPVHFQLDTDLTEAWQTMITADFFVLSKSTFSIVPAILNRNGQIFFHPRSYFAALPGFIHVSDDIVEEAERGLILMQKQRACFEPGGWRRQ